MDCELAQQKIALFAYGELPDDQCHLLEGHLTTCKRCQEEFAAVQALQQAMALAPTLEPSANLLAQARLRLEEALDTHAAKRLADACPAVHVPRRQHARPGSGCSLRAAGSGPRLRRLGRLFIRIAQPPPTG